MSAWAGGYVADVEYIPGYYRQQSPQHLALSCLLVGVDPALDTEGLHYLELGCGQGVGALLLAASNPSWRVTAVDYNPVHVAAARRLARETGVGNVTFLEADLATLADDPGARSIPTADVVSLHGVWSWVPSLVRAGIIRLLAAKVAPGGLVHVSYNALPAWQGGIGFQRLLLEEGRRSGAARSDRQAEAGLQLARDLHAAGAAYLRDGQLAASLIEGAPAMPPGYLAHEYMNECWAPCFHADVAADLSAAKLEWVASANLLETFPDLSLTEAQRAIVDRFDDPLMRELAKDACLTRQLRHDVFARGSRRVPPAARDAALREVTLTLAVPAARVDYELDVPAGRAQLGSAFRTVVELLGQGSESVGALLGAVPGHSNPAEIPGLLVGTGQALPVARPGTAQAEGARRVNLALGRRVSSVTGPETGGGVASHALGAALPVSRLEQFVLSRVLDGEDLGNVDGWVEMLGVGLVPEVHGTLRGLMLQAVEERLPVMRLAGVL